MARKPKYYVTLDMKSAEYQAKGDTVYQALSNLSCNYTHIKTKGVIKVKHGDKEIEKLFYMKPLRMLITSPVRRTWWAKCLTELVDKYE